MHLHNFSMFLCSEIYASFTTTRLNLTQKLRHLVSSLRKIKVVDAFSLSLAVISGKTNDSHPSETGDKCSLGHDTCTGKANRRVGAWSIELEERNATSESGPKHNYQKNEKYMMKIFCNHRDGKHQ